MTTKDKSIDELNKQAARDRRKRLKMEKEIAKLQEESKKHLLNLGWQNLPDHVLHWLQHNYDKHFKYFKPSERSVIEAYERETGKTVILNVDSRFVGNEQMQLTNAWVSPDGEFFGLHEFADHERWAADYLIREKGREWVHEKVFANHSYHHLVLEDLGWIRILTWKLGETNFSKGAGSRVTKRQKDTVQLFCSLHGINEPLFL